MSLFFKWLNVEKSFRLIINQGKINLKPKMDSTTHPSKWPKWKSLTTVVADIDPLEVSCIASERVNLYSYLGKFFDMSLYIWSNTRPLAQQFHLKCIPNNDVCKSAAKDMHRTYYSSIIFNSSKLEITKKLIVICINEFLNFQVCIT